MPCVLPVLSLKLPQASSAMMARISAMLRLRIPGLGGRQPRSLPPVSPPCWWALKAWAARSAGHPVPAALVPDRHECCCCDAVRRQPLGWFEIPVPGLRRPAGRHRQPRHARGQFGTGVFGTLLATPCSAPVRRHGVGVRAGARPLEISPFLALGVGFARAAICWWPCCRDRQLLPRPGRWMIVLRRILGLLLAGTADVAAHHSRRQRPATPPSGDRRSPLLAVTAGLWARHRLPISSAAGRRRSP